MHLIYAAKNTANRSAFTQNETGYVLTLFMMRWLAGILENFGMPRLSEITAILMLAGLSLLFLQRMRIANSALLFLVGILMWIVSGVLSHAANPEADAQATVTLLTLLMLYGLFTNIAALRLQDSASQPYIARSVSIFIVVGLGLSLAQIATGNGFIEPGRVNIQRAFGSDVHPVSFAIQIVTAMVALEITRLKQGRLLGWTHVAILSMGTTALYLTYARTAWVMALIVIAVTIIMRGSVARRAAMASITFGIGLTVFLSSERFTDLGSLPFFLSNFSFQDVVFDWRYIDNSVSWRIVNWSIGLQQALEKPWLGHGPGQSALSSFFNLEMHNIFLEAFFEGGIVGLFALLITLTGLLKMHMALPNVTKTDTRCRILCNGFGIALLLAVTFSTSFVDQLMSFLLYQLLLAVTASPCHKPRH